MSLVVLLASGVGGVIGFFCWINVFHAGFNGGGVMTAIASGLFDGGGVALPLAALALAYVWRPWWWRWPIMLSWFLVVVLIADEQPTDRIALLPLIGLPFLAAAVGASARGYARPDRSERLRRT